MAHPSGTSDENMAQKEEPSRIGRLKSVIGKPAFFATQNTVDRGNDMASAPPGNIILKSLNAALKGSDLLAKDRVERMQFKQPQLTIAQQLAKLDTRFLNEVTVMGLVVGASAAIPGPGTIAALGLATGNFTTFLTATCVHVQSVARVLDVNIEDADHARRLVLTVLLGGSGSSTVQKIAERTGSHLGGKFVKAVPASTLKEINKVMGRHFITKYGTKQGVLVLGKIAPGGFGAILGTGGNYLLGQTMVKATQKTFQEFLPDDVDMEEKDNPRTPLFAIKFEKHSSFEEKTE